MDTIEKIKSKLLPKTMIGKISLGLSGLGIFLFFLTYAGVITADFGSTTPFLIPLTIAYLSLGLIMISGITSIVSIVRYKDKAILLFASASIGILGILLVLREVLFPT
jgi:hypothetical protein